MDLLNQLSDNGLSKTYSITDFNWKVTSLDDFEITGGKVTDILALKNLANGNPASGDKVTDLDFVVTKDNCLVGKYIILRRGKKKYFIGKQIANSFRTKNNVFPSKN